MYLWSNSGNSMIIIFEKENECAWAFVCVWVRYGPVIYSNWQPIILILLLSNSKIKKQRIKTDKNFEMNKCELRSNRFKKNK